MTINPTGQDEPKKMESETITFTVPQSETKDLLEAKKFLPLAHESYTSLQVYSAIQFVETGGNYVQGFLHGGSAGLTVSLLLTGVYTQYRKRTGTK
jgi:hypothetical protein